MLSSLATPRNICYRRGGLSYIDYSGRALAIYDGAANLCRIFCDVPDLADEIVYLTVLSRVSALLEKERLHRIHGLGLEHAERGVLVLLPCGGGKTTLALELLRRRRNGVRLVSEDSPLLGKDGALLPFPLRLGVAPGEVPAGVPHRFRRLISRMEYGPKVTIDIRHFGDRIRRRPVKNRLVLVGLRSTGMSSRLVPISGLGAVRAIIMNSVIGVGLYQGMEFIMHRGFRGLLHQARTIPSRLRNCLRLALGSRFYLFVLSRDPRSNARALERFLQATEEGGGPAR
jgi:hypothetical protein